MNNNMKSRLARCQPPILCQVEEDLIDVDGDERQRERREETIAHMAFAETQRHFREDLWYVKGNFIGL